VVRQRKHLAGGSWTRPSAWVDVPGAQTSAFAMTRQQQRLGQPPRHQRARPQQTPQRRGHRRVRRLQMRRQAGHPPIPMHQPLEALRMHLRRWPRLANQLQLLRQLRLPTHQRLHRHRRAFRSTSALASRSGRCFRLEAYVTPIPPLPPLNSEHYFSCQLLRSGMAWSCPERVHTFELCFLPQI
jgi:hypothetical protein